MFSNFDDIFRLNLDLLRQLEVESKKPPSQMDAGQLFLDFADKFQVYAIYCANANAAKKRMEALALSNKRFAEFCEKARGHSAHKGLDIGSFLIKPLQRLCQYPLLLRELLEALPDQQNVPFAKLQRAHQVMSETVETVNGMLKVSLFSSAFCSPLTRSRSRSAKARSCSGCRTCCRTTGCAAAWCGRAASSPCGCRCAPRSSIRAKRSPPKSGRAGSRGCFQTCSSLASARRARRPTACS